MTMHKALEPRYDVDRHIYVSRKEGGSGLSSIEDSVMHRYNNSKITEKIVDDD